MERSLAQLIIIGGFCLMILGTYANLSAIDEKSSGAHLDVPKIDEKILKPSEGPHDFLDEKIKNIEKAMEEKYAKVEEASKIQELKKNLEQPLLKANNTQITAKLQKPSPPPPLPVDEIHPQHEEVNAKEKKSEEIKPPLVLENKKEGNEPPAAKEEIKIVEKEVNLKLNFENKIAETKPEIAKKSEDGKTTASAAALPQQTIDHDAIRKDEEIAKEEMKIEKKQENEELKKTKEELEKTKDLLEKKVEELKEELVKQNQETQNLVVEKLGEVVEKFEEIERKVQNQKVDDSPKEEKQQNKPQEDLNHANNTDSQIKPSKGSLISILTENRNLSNDHLNNTKQESAVYEPLSYKTGELIEHARNGSNLEKRLPLPLALLINASQAKINDTNVNIKLLNQTLSLSNKTMETDKINIDSIRREILQLHETADITNPTKQTLPLDNKENTHRIKRSNLMTQDNCLPEPNIEQLMAAASSLSNGGGDLEMKIGRDLKSINTED
uniref:Mitochondrial ATPase inhibitor, IATP n=1 Tax=Musca domestica TaxID=7370 RepID=T1PJH9_MUSDO